VLAGHGAELDVGRGQGQNRFQVTRGERSERRLD
jgi:hypothetical protein